MIALVLLLLPACSGPTLPPRVVEEVDPLALIAPLDPPAGSELDVRVTVLADASTSRLSGEPLAIDVYLPDDLSPSDVPMLHRAPLARHVYAQPAIWPVVDVVTVAAVAGAQLVPWLDVDRSGDLSPGDRVGSPVPLVDAVEAGDGLQVTLEVGRILTTVAASPERVDVLATVTYPRLAPRGRLMLLGYAADAVGPQGPTGRPHVRWISSHPERVDGERLTVPLPVEPALWLMAGVDTDRDGNLEQGDLVSRPIERFEASKERSLALQIDQALFQ